MGGHQRWGTTIPPSGDRKGVGALDRMGIAALDPASGVPLSWNPGRDRGLVVWRITPTAQGLYVLNDSLNFGGEYHARFTYLLTVGGTAPVRGIQHALPTNLVYTGTTIAGGSVTPGQLSQRSYDGTTFADEAPRATPRAGARSSVSSRPRA